MRRIIAILITAMLFGTLLACASGSCSDSGGGVFDDYCPSGYYPLWNESTRLFECVKECPTGYTNMYNPEIDEFGCVKNCPDGNPPTYNESTSKWECNGSPTIIAHGHRDANRHRHIITNRFTNHNSDSYSHQCANGNTHGNGNLNRWSRLHRRHLERHTGQRLEAVIRVDSIS